MTSGFARCSSRLADTEKRLAELREARRQALAKASALAEDDTESPLAGAMTELEAALADATNGRSCSMPRRAQSQFDTSFDAGSCRSSAAVRAWRDFQRGDRRHAGTLRETIRVNGRPTPWNRWTRSVSRHSG